MQITSEEVGVRNMLFSENHLKKKPETNKDQREMQPLGVRMKEIGQHGSWSRPS